MIEQSIYFALGFAVAGLVALGFTPILWARALRLTRRQLQAQIPVSMQEVLADRDQLRAEFAVSARTLEQETERLRAGKASDLAELGRRAAEISKLTAALEGARSLLAAQEAELRQSSRDNAESAAGLAAAQLGLQQNHAWFEQRLSQHEALKHAKAGLEQLLEQAKGTAGILQRRVSGLEMTIEESGRKQSALLHDIEATRRQAALAAEERDHLANQLATAQAAQETLRRRLVAETAEVAALREAKRALQSDLDAARVKLRISETAVVAASRSPQAPRDREDRLRESLTSAQWRVATPQPGGVSPINQPGGVSPINQPGGVSQGTLSGGVSPINQPGGVSQGTLSGGVSQGTLSGGASLETLAPGASPEAIAAATEAELRDTIHSLGLAIAAMAPVNLPPVNLPPANVPPENPLSPVPAGTPAIKRRVTFLRNRPPATPASVSTE